jgi:Lantibiotic dehydratase, N terminus
MLLETDRHKAQHPTHLVDLPGSDWALWRWSCLRGAGFPVSFALRLAAPEAAEAADRVLDKELEVHAAKNEAVEALMKAKKSSSDQIGQLLAKAATAAKKGTIPAATGTDGDAAIEVWRNATGRAATALDLFHQAFDRSRPTVFRAAQDLACQPQLQEAVTWQNRSALETGFASLLRADPTGLRSKDRKHELLLASYVQRYAMKNDTIGFFGPVGWARLSVAGEAISAHPAANLISRREVYFEQWGIDALAAKLSKDERLSPWMTPRRLPFLRIQGTTVYSPINGTHELTPNQAQVLSSCDGKRTARDLASSVLNRIPQTIHTEAEVFLALRTLAERGLVAWAFELPLGWHAEEALRNRLSLISDTALRSEALAPLEELCECKRQVALAAGNAERLGSMFNALDATFTRLTGTSSSRNAGAMYAARLLVFEDCRRDIDVAVGPAVLGALGPALSLVLASARWFTFETARVYREAFRGIYSALDRKGRPVHFADLWFRAQRLLLGTKDRPLDAVVTELQARWSKHLVLPPNARRVDIRSADLREAVLSAFDAPRPGWYAARYHSPDVMIAATNVDAVRRGEFQLVLGEIHASLNTLDYGLMFEQHPRPDELRQGLEQDMQETVVVPVYAKDSPLMTVRTTRSFIAPWSYFLETGFDVAPGPRDRVLALGDLIVEELDGQLVVRLPDGHTIELIELFGRTLAPITTQAFAIFPKRGRTPRITIDRLVVCRESWTLPASEFAFAELTDEPARFLSARRWARRHDLPRFVFAKSPLEVKPVFVDFDSPIFVNLLAKLARTALRHGAGEQSITLTEMLPAPEETWLPDVLGQNYTSELRLVAVDQAH